MRRWTSVLVALAMGAGACSMESSDIAEKLRDKGHASGRRVGPIAVIRPGAPAPPPQASATYTAQMAATPLVSQQPGMDLANKKPRPLSEPLTADQKSKLASLGYLGGPPEAQREFYDQADRASTEAYDRIVDNAFLAARENPLSTFSIDVDTASYANVRRFLQSSSLPPKDAVRIEELLNYFTYNYPQPDSDQPFSVNVEVAAAPWKLEHRLVRVGLRGRDIPVSDRPASNLVFLIDVSGSMNQPDKLPLLQQALKTLVVALGERDRVAIVVYAGASGLVLPSTTNRRAMLDALNELQAGGSTNGGQGIELAYAVARQNFIDGGNNRVILATDGDFNVGVTNVGDLTRLIEAKAKSKVFLSVLGFGTGNTKDATMEKLADKGNGNYSYIDTLQEARKVLVSQMGGTLFTIAKDVKIQVEFNPAKVAAYRLIGYENRMLEAQDFNDDTKDAGEIGAGHTVTALYEVVPAGQSVPGVGSVDPLKYQTPPSQPSGTDSPELLTVKLRYKQPEGDTSQLIEVPVNDAGRSYDAASPDFKFAAAVASFGMLLRDSEYKGSSTFDAVLELADEGRGEDHEGYRGQFLQLVKQARALTAGSPSAGSR